MNDARDTGNSDPIDDVLLATRLAKEAGRILLELRSSSKLSGKALGEAGDAAANAILMRELRAARRDDAILCEEEKDELERLAQRRVWIIDPLDGTREYGEGRSDWAVHVGLAVDGAATLGAVALPALDMAFDSHSPASLRAPSRPLKMVISRTRPAAQAIAVAEALGADLLPMGSAGAKAMAIIRGEADIYLHTGGQYEWDNCAPVAVAQAAGLHCSRIDGAPMRYNSMSPYLPDLLICRAEWREKILELIART